MNHEGPSPTGVPPLAMTEIVIVAFLLALDAVALGIRLRSRSLQGLSLCFNDYALLLAWVCTTMLSTLRILFIRLMIYSLSSLAYLSLVFWVSSLIVLSMYDS